MIAAHDSFTYLKSEDILSELFSFSWRCQTRSIHELYNLGIRFFDIRIVRNMKKGYINKFILHKEDTPTWSIAHGVAEIKDKELYSLSATRFYTIDGLCNYFELAFPEAKYRIILERDSKRYKEQFINEITGLEKRYKNLLWYGIKHPWEELYKSPDYPQIEVDYICHPLNWNMDQPLMYNIKNFKFDINIKKYARKNNPPITQEMKDDPDILFWMDHIYSC